VLSVSGCEVVDDEAFVAALRIHYCTRLAALMMEVFVSLKHCVMVLSFGLLSCVLSPNAAAQSPNTCLATTTWWFPLSIPRGWSYYGPYPGTLTYVIWAWKATCPPPKGPDEVCLDCEKTKAAAGLPINLATGNTYIKETDVRIPGLSGGLALARSWNSKWPASQSALQVGLFGPNWRSTYEEQVFVGSDNYIKYSRGDGSFWSFGTSSSTPGTWALAAPQDVSATLTTPNTATPYWTITLQNGEQRQFDGTSGMLTSIIDRNGNTTTIAYDGANRLATVTDPVSRHLYFGYGSPSSHLVTSVTSDVGISLSYAYDAQNRLSVITNPDLTTLTFGYDSHSFITSVTDINSKILESHTYDSNGRGLTSSRALGVEAVTVTYPVQ
jgi:YD repeat-containing protein